MTDAVRRHSDLVREIRSADDFYYNQDAPVLTDAEYDALRRELVELEAAHPELVTKDSPTQTVGAAEPSRRFGKVEHAVPMLSLDNAFSDEDVAEFVKRVRRFLKLDDDAVVACTAEPKIDGLSAALRYENGRFVQGATRGNGRVVEVVSRAYLADKVGVAACGVGHRRRTHEARERSSGRVSPMPSFSKTVLLSSNPSSPGLSRGSSAYA